VDVHDQSGKTLADVPRSTPVAQAADYGAPDLRADDEVRRVIAANLGRAHVAMGAASAARKAASAPVAPFAPLAPAADADIADTTVAKAH
jgi:membrane fusion protein, multidrug efflux system